MRLFNLIKDGKVKGLAAKPSMFSVNSGAKKNAFKAALLSNNELRALFESKATAGELKKPDFVAFLTDLLAGSLSPPSDKDFEAAFELADENKSNTIDVEEFLKIFNNVKAGKVKGLGTAFQGSAAARRKLESDYKEGLQKAAFDVGDEVLWTKADEDIPAGTIGQILRVHLDGDVEVLFPMVAGGTDIFTFGPTEIILKSTATSPTKAPQDSAPSETAPSTTTPVSEPAPDAKPETTTAPPAPLDAVGNPVLEGAPEDDDSATPATKGFEFPCSLIICP